MQTWWPVRRWLKKLGGHGCVRAAAEPTPRCPGTGRVPAAVSPQPCQGHQRHHPTALKAAVLFLPVVRELAFLTVFWVSSGRHPRTPSDSEAPSPGEASH